jgi:hypothetical protein
VKLKTREAWWLKLHQMSPQELDAGEREALSQILRGGVMMKALNLILCRIPGMAIDMMQAKMNSQEEINELIRRQGMATGLTQAVELLAEMATSENKGDQDGEAAG